jgi:hypothetical protein
MSGFTKPTTTQTPDALFDYWLTRLTGSELRVLLYAIRRTFGFGKDSDAISLNQFLHGITTQDGRVLDEGTGISRPALLAAIKKLTAKGLMVKTRQSTPATGDQVNVYRLVIEDHRSPRAERGFRSVNTTQVPDELFDYWLPRLSDAELKVILYIVRRTLGFRKRVDGIGPRQFLHGVTTAAGRVLDDGCGLSERHLYAALAGLKERGLIAIERRRHHHYGNIPSLYGLVFEGEWPALIADLDPREQPDALIAEQRVQATSPDPRLSAYRTGVTHGRGGDSTGKGGRSDTGGREVKNVKEGGKVGTEGRQSADERQTAQGREGSSTGKGGRSRKDGTFAPEINPQQTDSQETVRRQTVAQQTDSHHTDQSKLSRDTSTEWSSERSETHAHACGRARLYSGAIATCIEDWSGEFHDSDRFIQNRTRVMRMWANSNLDEEAFLDLMYEARRRTKRALVQKDASDGRSSFAGAKNRMPYFFAVLDDLLAEQAQGSGGDPEPTRDDSCVMEAQAVWQAVLDELRLVLTNDNYETWLSQTQALGLDGDLLRIAVARGGHRDWLRDKLGRRIESTLQRLGHGRLHVAYVVAPDDARSCRETADG